MIVTKKPSVIGRLLILSIIYYQNLITKCKLCCSFGNILY